MIFVVGTRPRGRASHAFTLRRTRRRQSARQGSPARIAGLKTGHGIALTSPGRLPYKPPQSRARCFPLAVRIGANDCALIDGRRSGVQRRESRETNLPTKQIGAQAPTRVSRTHGDHGRSQGCRGAARARAQAAQCVSGNAVPSFVERLKRRSDFRAVASGARASGKAFVLQALCRAEHGAVRVGFTVSRQVGDAVERNRVRRRLREIVRLSDTGRLRAGHDYVVVGRRAALAVPFGEMVQDFDAALGRVHAKIHAPADAPVREQAAASVRATGGGRADFLHQPGSASRPPRPQRRRRDRHGAHDGAHAPSPAEPPEFPPQER